MAKKIDVSNMGLSLRQLWSILGHKDGSLTVSTTAGEATLSTERTFREEEGTPLETRIARLIVLNRWDLRLITGVLSIVDGPKVEAAYERVILHPAAKVISSAWFTEATKERKETFPVSFSTEMWKRKTPESIREQIRTELAIMAAQDDAQDALRERAVQRQHAVSEVITQNLRQVAEDAAHIRAIKQYDGQLKLAQEKLAVFNTASITKASNQEDVLAVLRDCRNAYELFSK